MTRIRQPIRIASYLGLLLATLLVPQVSAGNRNKALLRVESVPPGALVSVLQPAGSAASAARTVAGETPLEKTFDFGKPRRLRLQIERRGFLPATLEVTPESRRVDATLEALAVAAGVEGEEAPPAVRVVAVVPPDITVTRRGFSKEQVSAEDSAAASSAVAETVRSTLSPFFQVVNAGPPGSPALKSLWRDARTAIEMLDPIRLPYLPSAPRLETRAGVESARTLGEAVGADAVLLITGRENVETGGMRAGKVALVAAGTAASYASGYSRAVSNGDSFFTYNVYLPSFAEGTALQAVLIDCRRGDVLWLDKGLWKRVDFGQPADTLPVVKDLLAGLARLAAGTTGTDNEGGAP